MRSKLSLLLALGLSGCASVPAKPIIEHRDATNGLIERSDFRAAAQAAPQWVSEALLTITRYEAELARK